MPIARTLGTEAIEMGTEQQSVRDLAGHTHAAARVFNNHGISFCCQGDRPFLEVCEENQLSPETVLKEIEQTESDRNAILEDRTHFSTPELIDHIVSTHHAYLKTELPRIQ